MLILRESNRRMSCFCVDGMEMITGNGISGVQKNVLYFSQTSYYYILYVKMLVTYL